MDFKYVVINMFAGVCIILFLVGCRSLEGSVANALHIERPPVEGGTRDEGYQLLMDYGCGSCHRIPGIPGATSYVGPPLDNWSQRQYIAGSYPNNLENLTVWIMNPQGLQPDTAMPILGVSEQEALHMSAYLYSLGE